MVEVGTDKLSSIRDLLTSERDDSRTGAKVMVYDLE